MLKIIINDIRYFGVKTLCRHAVAKLTGDREQIEKYWLAKQVAGERLTLEQIKWLSREAYLKAKGTEMHWDAPQTFDEKIRWGMLYDATPLKTRLVDKYLARDYVAKKIGVGYTVALLGVYNCFDEIDFEKLPEQFVLKLNNGSGMNIVVKDKAKLDKVEAKKRFDRWMKLNFAYLHFEMQYRDVPQKIIAEEYIEQMDGNLYDYKFHCADGKVFCCQVIGDRDLESHKAKQAFFDRDWKWLDISAGCYPAYNKMPEKPEKWEEMLRIAETLAEGFWYVRLDLFFTGEHIYFSEFTFTPNAGLHPHFSPKELDLEWGRKLKLPKPYELEIPKRQK